MLPNPDLYDVLMLDEIQEDLLEAYDTEKMDPTNRWKQKQLDELQGFVVLEQLALIQEENEQLPQIDTVQQLQEEKEQKRNTEQVIRQELWK
ncbi:unnamed protein product [Rotaria sp. Silwood2]|nr:unnamed protein product [Rotaria sp. Silwood2]CAF4026197.1 unnamed protein product [Rotaria sp. Silwood2]